MLHSADYSSNSVYFAICGAGFVPYPVHPSRRTEFGNSLGTADTHILSSFHLPFGVVLYIGPGIVPSLPNRSQGHASAKPTHSR